LPQFEQPVIRQLARAADQSERLNECIGLLSLFHVDALELLNLADLSYLLPYLMTLIKPRCEPPGHLVPAAHRRRWRAVIVPIRAQ